MLKILGIHFIGGILAVTTREIAVLIPENIKLELHIVTSIIMAIYFIWAGYFLRNESLHKTIVLLQIFVYSGHFLFFLGESAYRFLRVATGGSVVWNRIHEQVLTLEKLSYTLTYFLTFFIFPVLIIAGRTIAGKPLKINIKKDVGNTLKILLCTFTASTVYPVSSFFMDRFDESGDIITAYISLFAVIAILFVGGIALRKIEWSKICFIMFISSLVGITFTMYITKSLANALSGGGMVINLFFETVIGIETNYTEMPLLPLIFVLAGHFTGNRILANTAFEKRSPGKLKHISQAVLMQLAGGLIVFYMRELALMITSESIRMAAFIVISLFMLLYYVWIGHFFKGKSFYSACSVILIMTFIGFSTEIFTTEIYRYSTCLTGSGSIWIGVLNRLFSGIRYHYHIVISLMILCMAFGYIISNKRNKDAKEGR